MGYFGHGRTNRQPYSRIMKRKTHWKNAHGSRECSDPGQHTGCSLELCSHRKGDSCRQGQHQLARLNPPENNCWPQKKCPKKCPKKVSHRGDNHPIQEHQKTRLNPPESNYHILASRGPLGTPPSACKHVYAKNPDTGLRNLDVTASNRLQP